VFRQQRVFHRVVALPVGEGLTLGRHTVTCLWVTLGWVDGMGAPGIGCFGKGAFSLSTRKKHPVRSEVRAAQVAWRALRWALRALGRGEQRILFVGDGHDDHQDL